jgi:Flp pilus assembly protein TadD
MYWPGRTVPTLARALGLTGVMASSLVTGCSGHGKFTQEALDVAKSRQAKLKAAADYDLAHTQFVSGNLDEALKTVDRSIRSHDEVPVAHVLRGRILLEQGLSLPAMESFETAATLDAEDPEIDYYKGVVQERIGQTEAALGCYQRALTRERTNPQYGLATAETLIDLHRFAEARDLLESATGDAASHPGYPQTLGHLAMLENDLEGAARWFERAVALDPTDPSLREDLARVQIRLGRFPEAEAHLAAVLSQPPFDQRRDLQYLHACCLLELRRPVEARARFLTLIDQPNHADSIDALVKLVDVAMLLEDEGLLRMTSQRLVGSAPQRPEGYLALALLQRRQGNFSAALDNIDRALIRRPDDVAANQLKTLVEQQLAAAVGG